MKSAIISILVSSAALASAPGVHAGPAQDATGPYGGVALGASALHSEASTVTLDDDRGSTFHLYGGYRFTDRWGAELGYVRIGDASQTGVGGSRIIEARSYYAAMTGRIALSETFSLNGKLGLSFGDIGSDKSNDGFSHATGHKRSAMAGVNAEYQPWERVALTVGYDYYGKLSDEISGGTLAAGVRFSF